MLISADFLSISPSTNMTLPVRQVSKPSCQLGFLRNLTGLLPAYLPRDLKNSLKDGIKVKTAGAFRDFSSRKSLLNSLP